MERRTNMDNNTGKYMVVLYTKPCDCGGNCLYCIKESKVTRSTVPNQDTLLAVNHNWSSSKQLISRCQNENVVLNTGNKFELRIKGNSFTNYDPKYLESYIKEVYDLLNGFESETFEKAFKAQETAKDKCVQVVIETRPDQITDEWCRLMRKWGVTSVEIGVQSLSDKVLQQNNRGHLTNEVRRATKLIRSYGFELGFQVMLGLYGSDEQTDADMLTTGLWQDEYYPDSLKVYPCLLLLNEEAQQPLYNLFNQGLWKPIGDDEYDLFLRRVLPHIPPDAHVNRLQRIFREDEVAYGPFKIIDRSKYRNITRCMWQRSFQNNKINYSDIKNWHYETYSHGDHACVQCVTNDDVILGFIRFSILNNRLVIRDIRTLGRPLKVGEGANIQSALQHRGIGKEMLKIAELYAKEKGVSQAVIYSSAGCVGYFKKCGYVAENMNTLVKFI